MLPRCWQRCHCRSLRGKGSLSRCRLKETPLPALTSSIDSGSPRAARILVLRPKTTTKKQHRKTPCCHRSTPIYTSREVSRQHEAKCANAACMHHPYSLPCVTTNVVQCAVSLHPPPGLLPASVKHCPAVGWLQHKRVHPMSECATHASQPAYGTAPVPLSLPQVTQIRTSMGRSALPR